MPCFQFLLERDVEDLIWKNKMEPSCGFLEPDFTADVGLMSGLGGGDVEPAAWILEGRVWVFVSVSTIVWYWVSEREGP